MARQAREKDDYGVYYITQYSSGDRDLFICNKDRERFLNILHRAQKKFNFRLYAYCITSINEYHLVLDVNGGDLSKIMKSINISYAMYAKCDGKLFKDRYKSTLLKNKEDQLQVIDRIHSRMEDQSVWNSYCSFKGLVSEDEDIEIPIVSSTTTSHMNQRAIQHDECIDCIKSFAKAEEKLKEIADLKHVHIADLINDKDQRNSLIREFRKQSTLSLKELGKLFGGISESSVCKIINQ